MRRKRILSFVLIIFVAILLVGCKKKTTEAIDEALGKLQVKEAVWVDFTLPTKIDDVKIGWKSSNTNLLKVGTETDEGVVIEVTNPDETTEVTLTATLTEGKGRRVADFTVEVWEEDTEAPVFKYRGEEGLPEKIEVDYKSKPNWLANIQAVDNYDGVVNIEVDDSNVKLDELGQYNITLTAKDTAGNENVKVIPVVVADLTEPLITGYKLYVLNVGDEAPNWLDGVTAHDIVDGEVEVNVDDSGVELTKAGKYRLTYTAVDKAENEGRVRVEVRVVAPEQEALGALDLPGKTTKNLNLKTEINGVNITWDTSNADAITNAGKVTMVDGREQAVKLTATAGSYERVFWVTVRDKKADIDATYSSAFSEIQTLNPLMSEGAADSDVYENLTDTFFSGDYDWEYAMDNEYADFPGDFSKIKSERNPSGTVEIANIPYKRTLKMASRFPYAVTQGTDNAIEGSYGRLLDQEAAKETLDDKWIITLRDDLKFEDGTPITTETVEYAFKQYLNGKLANARANYLYNEDYVPLVNGKAYYDGNAKWEDVGFRIIDDHSFEIRITRATTQYDLMGSLSIINLVHVESFEKGFNSTGTENNYGSVQNPLVSYGEFTLKNDYDDTEIFTFTRNDDHYNSWDIPFKTLNGPIIKDQTQIINEFKNGSLDVAGVGGEYWDEYKDNENLYIAPSNSFYRLAISLERPDNKAKPILQYAEFRRALYLATDRDDFAENVQPPSEGALGFLSNIHQVSEWSNESYATSDTSLQQLEDLGLKPDRGGYDSAEAKRLFDKVRQEAIEKGQYGANEVIQIEFLYYDAGSNTRIANWVKAQYEEVFNEEGSPKVFEVKLNPVSSDELSAQRDAGDFDLVFTGMNGATFQATFGMGYIFSPTFSSFLAGKGHGIPTKEVTADITNLFSIVAAKDKYDAKVVRERDGELPEGMRTASEQGFYDELKNSEGTYTGTFDGLFELFSKTPELEVDYLGQTEDLTNITAALEKALLEQMIAVPLFSSTSAAVYAPNVVRQAHAYHLFLGWGGMSYMYKTK